MAMALLLSPGAPVPEAAIRLTSPATAGFTLMSEADEPVKKLTPEGELLDFAPKGGETFYFGLQYGPDGILYGVRGVRAVFKY